MSNTKPMTPSKSRAKIKHDNFASSPKNIQIENNLAKSPDHVSARTFALWYKKMMDYERNDLGPYLADEVICHIFGKKIKTRKKVVGYLKYMLETTCHDFFTIKSKDHLTSEYEWTSSQETNELKNTHTNNSPEVLPSRERSARLRFDDSLVLHNDSIRDASKRQRLSIEQINNNYATSTNNSLPKLSCVEDISEVNNKGDGISSKKRKILTVTPPNRQVGQGDCLPSTSSSNTKIEQSNAYAYSQLAHVPRRVVECECFVKFIKNNEGNRSERKCKLQISYSEDPLNIGEYIIWAIYYTGDMKCRKNLLPLFNKLGTDGGGDEKF